MNGVAKIYQGLCYFEHALDDVRKCNEQRRSLCA